MLKLKTALLFLGMMALASASSAQRSRMLLLNDWKFYLGDDTSAKEVQFDDSKWHSVDIPHDWSIEGNFSKDHPSTFNQGALPTGIGWYRKKFRLPKGTRPNHVQINFEGVFQRADVWVNGHHLGHHNNGYVSFRYNLNTYLKKDDDNLVVVRVDNAAQPNSRWYTGSGVYRKVWLDISNNVFIDPWNLQLHTERNGMQAATVVAVASISHAAKVDAPLTILHEIRDKSRSLVASSRLNIKPGDTVYRSSLVVKNPALWSPSSPYLYTSVLKIYQAKKLLDSIQTNVGIRDFSFDSRTGFTLNGKHFLIKGVCNHHDLGALGAAVNRSALQRQMRILKDMGVNAIRTAHNPPSVELLDLCDSMGFLVMDELYDTWAKKKNKWDQSMDFKNDFQSDVENWIRRDRNHPSVFMWSIGNEIREQFDSSGIHYAQQLSAAIKKFDTTRPITSALTENIPSKNFIYQSGALDVLGFNYKSDNYASLPGRFPGSSFIAAETASALATRGHYDFPSDSFRVWPPDSKSTKHGNPDNTVSAFDHVYAYWGNTHEKSWLAVKQNPHMSGAFVWSGFDFLGEPVPYQWPSRSSYYGIIDLAGFPKDIYYMYQSEWTDKPVLHLFPHWNWQEGQKIDVWAYFSQADEVELFLNGKSLGIKTKNDTTLHAMWRVDYVSGTLKAISRLSGKVVMTDQVQTAGKPHRIILKSNTLSLSIAEDALAFVEVQVTDQQGVPVQHADNLINIEIMGAGKLRATDNGNPVGMDAFNTSHKKLFNGKLLAMVGAAGKKGKITIKATSPGLESATAFLMVK